MSITYTWNTAGGSWSDDENWTPTGVPGADDNAIIDTNVSIDAGAGSFADDVTFEIDEALTGQFNDDLSFLSGTLTTSSHFRVDGDDDGTAYLLEFEPDAVLNATSPSDGKSSVSVDSNGFLFFDDSSLVETQGGVVVGYNTNSNGTLEIENGGSAVISNTNYAALTLGDDDGSYGVVNVRGAGSTLRVDDSGVNDGFDGTGALNIDDGASAAIDDGLYLGSNSGSSGVVRLVSNGAQLAVRGGLDVGYGGQGNFDVESGASATVDYLDIAVQSTSGSASANTPSLVTVDDASESGATLTVTNRLTVGDGGFGRMIVTDDGQASADSLVIANLASSGDTADNNNTTGYLATSSVVVDDDGGLTITGEATVGDDGYGALQVENGATASLGGLVIAAQATSGSLEDDAPSFVGVAGIDGVRAQLTVQDEITVGALGYGNLTIETAGYVSAASLDVAAQTSASGSYIYISGAATANNDTFQSTLAIADEAVVGDGGFGLVDVENGALMTAGSLDIAEQATSGSTQDDSPSYVLVTGEDDSLSVASELDVTGAITVGDSGYGELAISAGATAFGGSLVVANQGSSGAYGAGHSFESADTGAYSYVDVDDSSLTISGAATVGNAGYAGVLVEGGGSMSVGSLVIANQQTSGETSLDDRSFVEVDDGALAVTDDATVGYAGYGALTDFSGATTIGGNLHIASLSTSGSAAVGAPSFVTVAGSGSSITVTGSTTVGDGGDGLLTVLHGGTFTTNGTTMEIAGQTGSKGLVSVEDDNSKLYAKNVVIGGSPTAAGGAGMLSAASGGSVFIDGSAEMWNGAINVDSQSLVAIGAGTATVATGVDVESGALLMGYGAVIGVIVNDGAIEADDGLLKLDDAVSGNGSDSIEAGGTLAFQASVGAGQAVFFGAGSGSNWGELDLTAEGTGATFSSNFQAGVNGFTGSGGTPSTSDVIDVTASGAGDDKAVWDQIQTGPSAYGTLTVETTNDSVLETLTLYGTYNDDQFEVSDPSAVDQITYAACYRKGTRILTDRGEVAIEALNVGDLAVTASGALRPIIWIGRRRVDISRHPEPAAVRPVRVSGGAFGAGAPSRDLWLSPWHNVACDGALMPIVALVNGISVAQIDVEIVEYWHVELDAHDVILAEGLPAESYLDTGNRAAFSNGGAFIEAHPDFRPKHWAETCLPLAQQGELVARTKARLIARLVERGYAIDHEPDAHVVADGRRIDPERLSQTRLAFALPEGARDIVLRSRSFVPAYLWRDNGDARELGLCVGRLEIDGGPVALDVETTVASGWREAEFVEGRFAHRWTSGAARLPAGARRVVVDLASAGFYWKAPEPAELPLSA